MIQPISPNKIPFSTFFHQKNAEDCSFWCKDSANCCKRRKLYHKGKESKTKIPEGKTKSTVSSFLSSGPGPTQRNDPLPTTRAAAMGGAAFKQRRDDSSELQLFQPTAKDFWSSREASYSLQSHCWAMHLQLLSLALGWSQHAAMHRNCWSCKMLCTRGDEVTLSPVFSLLSAITKKRKNNQHWSWT